MGRSEPNGRPARQRSKVLLEWVKIRNYKSIAGCDVQLGALTILVGRNGSGKSNFLDALRFIADGLRTSLDHAIRDRGGMGAVRRWSTGRPRNFALEIKLNLPTRLAIYGFEITARKHGGFSVLSESLRVIGSDGLEQARYQVKDGKLVSATAKPMPPVASDRLYLVNAAGLPEFREVYDAILAMGFYNLNPEAMRTLQSPDAGEILRRDGGNIASAIARIGAGEPETKARVRDYLKTIVPGIVQVDRVPLGPMETLEFRQEVVGAKSPWKFYAASMSDGTLRALGALVAVNQLAEGSSPVRLVGIEEPETALHPAASGALVDALREAATHTQVLVTTQSPDLLDQIDPERDHLLIVQANRGETRIGLVDAVSRQAIKDHLYTAGDLLRMDQLEPDRMDLQRQTQMRMFEGAGDAE